MSIESLGHQTHDYTQRTWGHDFYIKEVIDGGMSLRIGGWGSGIEDGDYLIFPNKNETTRYQVGSIKYMRDPPDMWFADVVFAPRVVSR